MDTSLPEELEYELRRVNRLAAEGDYRAARDLLRVLRAVHSDYADVLNGMDELFFQAEAERNSRLYPAKFDSPFTMPSGVLSGLGLMCCLFCWINFGTVWKDLLREGIYGTTTIYHGKVNRTAEEVPILPYVGWGTVSGVAALLLFVKAFQIFQREE